jgi:nickel-type superoxide dismutase maturation protease
VPPSPVTLPSFGGRRTPWLRRAVVAALGLTVVTLSSSVRRVEVVGSSMVPALLPGDRLVVVRRPWPTVRWPEPGQVVALLDPRDADRLLVKRVRAVHRGEGTLEVVGDDLEASTDSRSFGPVPRSSIVGRAVYRYGPPGRSGPVPRAGEYHRP